MTIAVGALNLVLGFIYLQYGTLTLIEMRRNWRQMGFSHFGAAWIAMAFTCGPHHFVHGLHLLLGGHRAGVLDLIAVIVGFPAGVLWFVLRVEAFRGGRGDRFVSGSPLRVLALPTVFGMYLTAMVAAVISRGVANPVGLAVVAPNLLLVVIYALIGYFLIRTQVANRRPLGGWSVSGLALACIFPTCSIMHAVYAYYALSGSYPLVLGGAVIDWLAVPAGAYFLWVVYSLYQGQFVDWNSTRAIFREGAAESAEIGAPCSGRRGGRMRSGRRARTHDARIASERAGAMAAFLAWPAPGGALGAPEPATPRAPELATPGAVRTPSLRTHALAAVIAVLIGCLLAVCSFLLPLTGASSLAWGAGPHLALFCHLQI